MAAIAVDILTPDRRVLQAQADSVVVPATDGELGILSHHTPLVAQLQPGEIRLRTGNDLKYFAVSGGFVEVQNNHVVVLAETAEMAHEIDVERARQAAERAKAVLRAFWNGWSIWRKPKPLSVELWCACMRWKLRRQIKCLTVFR